MVVNTQQLQYLVEIHRTGSISHAAANLYMSQPNLSRVLRDMEQSLGYPIFERTRKGVRPTQKGEQFLHHARNILRETGYMEQLGSGETAPNLLRICIPHSFIYMDLIQTFLNPLRDSEELHVQIRECHPRGALDLLLESFADVAILRSPEACQDYFTEQASNHRLVYVPLCKTEFQILVSRQHPLAEYRVLSREKLSAFTEIICRDEATTPQQDSTGSRCIYSVDRLAQIQLLWGNPSAYCWSEPLPEDFLRRNDLFQIPCADSGPVYCEALVYNPSPTLSDLEKALIEQLRNQAEYCTEKTPDISNF